MPGDPKECRERALRCEELARHTITQKGRRALLDLALGWNWLASEIENTNAIVASLTWEHQKMAWRQKTLKLAEGDAHLGLRFLSALMHGWDRLPAATQGWIMRDAFVMQNGLPPSGPEVLLAFVNTYKGSEPAGELAT
jgi:hypothetical protein